MKSQHTPGPWTLQHLEDNHGGYPDWSIFCIRSPKNNLLAEVGLVDRFESERIPANARLIAAAPELLEALQRLVNQIRDTCAKRKFSDGPLAIEFDAARAAIARTEGRGE
jgi:hypothetical protein